MVKVHPLERAQMADTLATSPHPTVWVRHFNFFDFESLDVAPPTWINIVRDPVSLKEQLCINLDTFYPQVERVISFFYYRRAGWYIVDRHLEFPDQPLPDPAFLRRDFETCVLQVRSVVC